MIAWEAIKHRLSKIFIYFSAGMTLALSCIMALLEELQSPGNMGRGFLVGAVTGFLGGGVAALVLSYYDYIVVSRRVPAYDGRPIEVHQKRLVEVALPPEQAFDACLEALASVRGIKIQLLDRDKWVIQAKTERSWESWGEKIEFRLERMEQGTRIEVSSQPLLRSTLLDYGKNYENVGLIIRYLTGR